MPHCIQVLTLLCLTGYGNQRDELENHLMQIRTGEGKSIALGGGAALLAWLGFQVRCICYSKYLSQRDEKAFSTLFEELQLQGSGRERIVYSTITQYSHLPRFISFIPCVGTDRSCLGQKGAVQTVRQ